MTQRQKVLLAALVPASRDVHSPVQVQKLMFLIDREVANRVGGPFFDFAPYNYGPFDKQVYRELAALSELGLVEISQSGTRDAFRLTEAGQKEGESCLAELPKTVRDYIQKVSEFVRSQTFSGLVSAIYKAYPDMKANSIFQG